jgi:4-hydroxy-4-methyl-2-oxoglutarate aldolase
MAYSTEQLELALNFGAATLHEAAGRIGALPSAIKPVAREMRLVGPAFTVLVPQLDNLWLHRALYMAKEGDILVVSTSGGIEGGYWGDILNEAAVAHGLGGLVIDGGVRDTARLRAMSLPVFSHGVCIQGTIKGFEAQAWTKQSIRIGKIVINHGDLVMGDSDGVVIIPAKDVNATLQKAVAREADEAAKVERIRAGERTIDLYQFGES